MYKVVFFVPESHKEIVKSAMFKAHAGKLGNYDCCSFEQMGVGQFRPLDGSSPFIGNVGMIEQVSEFKVEMICEDEYLRDVLMALKNCHPYEEPAFDVIKLVDVSDIFGE